MTMRRALAADLPAIVALWAQSPTNPDRAAWDVPFLLARARRGDIAIVYDAPPIRAAIVVQPVPGVCWHITEILWDATLTNLQITSALQNTVLPYLKAQRGTLPIAGEITRPFAAFWQARATFETLADRGDVIMGLDVG